MEKNRRSVLIIGSVWPEPDSSAAGRRMMQLIKLFRSQGFEITFASSAAKTEYRANLHPLDVETTTIALNSTTFDTFIQHLQPAVVMFDRFITEEQFGWRVAEHCPNALRLLDTEDLHCLRRARKKAVKEERDFSNMDLLHDDSAKREVASILRCDCSLMISEHEISLLKELFNVDESLLHYLPFLLEPIDDSVMQTWPGFDARTHFMTIGNFRHPPNSDAVHYLSEQIWPIIHEQLPDAQMHVYGAYPSQKAKQLHQPEKQFYIKGRAERSEEVIKGARVCLAALRFGAGLKGKLIEAMEWGTPSVTTSIGAEGIAGAMSWGGSIADSPAEFAAAAVKLYEEESAWKKAQKNGINIINQRFAKTNFGQNFLDQIMHLQDHLEEHRNRNFIGRMLMHHTAASTKYMGRWIEEKNTS